MTIRVLVTNLCHTNTRVQTNRTIPYNNMVIISATRVFWGDLVTPKLVIAPSKKYSIIS